MPNEKRSRQSHRIPLEEGVMRSSALERAYLQMSADTMSRKEAIEHKKALVAEIRGKQLMDSETLKNEPTVYVGSGIDFEYPLCLGARKIILVDPILKDSTVIKKLKQRVKTVAGHDPVVVSETQIQFLLDGEAVSIQFAAALYGSAEAVSRMQPSEQDELEAIERIRRALAADPNDFLITDAVKEACRTNTGVFAPDYVPASKERLPRFQPPEKIGLILGFQTAGTDLDADPESMSHLIDGGYLLTNNLMMSALSSEEPLYRFEPEERIGKVADTWASRGYNFIPLKSEGDSYQYTFLQKKKS